MILILKVYYRKSNAQLKIGSWHLLMRLAAGVILIRLQFVAEQIYIFEKFHVAISSNSENI